MSIIRTKKYRTKKEAFSSLLKKKQDAKFFYDYLKPCYPFLCLYPGNIVQKYVY